MKEDKRFLPQLLDVKKEGKLNSTTGLPSKPVIGLKLRNGYTVLINDTAYYINAQNLDFLNFLRLYLHKYISKEWYEQQLKIESTKRHPVANYLTIGDVNKDIIIKQKILRLSYDLYILESHGHKIKRKRLLNKDQFLSYRYEILIACIFLESGYIIKWEKSEGNSIVEFIATHRKTKISVAVECKKRESFDLNNIDTSLKRLQKKALEKKPKFPLFIFVDANLPKEEFAKHSYQNLSFIAERETKDGNHVVINITNILDTHLEGWPRFQLLQAFDKKSGFFTESIDLFNKIRSYPDIENLDYKVGNN